MKMRLFVAVVTIIGLFLGLLPVDSLLAQAPPADNSTPLLSQADLEQLVAPIALYPDPLVALILQGATVPTDIVLADRYVQNGGDPNTIDSQNWDDSVKGLARYPDTLKMMDDNLDWTNQLGAAVLAQQADVMNAIQAQRAKAEALGNLQTTAQQQVVASDQVIQILPADPQVIYVPVYDPQVVYVQPAPAVPFITFGIGFAIGAWLGGDCDWHNHGIYRGGYYRPGYGWGGNNVNININNNVNVWRPNPNKPRPRPPYKPGRPGGGGGNGQLPGWRPPPGNGGNRPGGPGGNRPGGPDKPGITPLPGSGNGGNRPGGPGNNPGNGNGGNRPGKPGNGSGNSGKPSILPAPGGSPGQTKPAPDKTRPGTRPGTTKPTPGHGSFNPDRPNTKRPTQPSAKPQPQRPQVQPRPNPQPKPAARQALQSRERVYLGRLRTGELEEKVVGEPRPVAFDRLVEAEGGNPVELGQVGIQNNALAAQSKNQLAHVRGDFR